VVHLLDDGGAHHRGLGTQSSVGEAGEVCRVNHGGSSKSSRRGRRRRRPGRQVVGKYVADGVVGPGRLGTFRRALEGSVLLFNGGSCTEEIVNITNEDRPILCSRFKSRWRRFVLNGLCGVDAASGQYLRPVLLDKLWVWRNLFLGETLLLAEGAHQLCDLHLRQNLIRL
jgi:hypothetical protein